MNVLETFRAGQAISCKTGQMPRTRTSHYARSSNDGWVLSSITSMVEERLRQGYDAYILTFMFKPLPGPPQVRSRLMHQAIEAAYAQSVTRLLRYPNSAHNRAHPLLWIGFPDYPVPKRRKQQLLDVSINEGRHFHVVVLVPPRTRLRRPFEVLVRDQPELFLVDGMFRVHVDPFERTIARGVSYFGKALTRGRATFEEVVFLPRSRFELSHPKWHPNRGLQGQVRQAPPV